MKKFVFSMLLLAGAVSCIDRDYDLSHVDSDIQIGNENTEIKMPLMTIQLDVDELNRESGENETSMQDLYRELDIWLPTATTEVEVQRLAKEPGYLQGILSDLLAEIRIEANEAKRLEVCNKIADSHADAFADALRNTNIPSDALNDISTGEAISRLLLRYPEQVSAAIDSVGEGFMVDLDLDPVFYELPELDGEVSDLLTGDEIVIYGTIESTLPFSLEFDYSLAVPSERNKRHTMNLNPGEKKSIDGFSIQASDIEYMAENTTEFTMNVVVTKYYKNSNFGGQKVTIDLKLKRKGALTF